MASGALLGLVAAIVDLAVGPRAGIAVLGVAVGVVATGLALMGHQVLTALTLLDRGQRRLHRRVERGSTVSRRALRSARQGVRVSRRTARRVRAVGMTTRELAIGRPAEVELLGSTHQTTLRLEARQQVDHHRFRTSLDTLPSDILRFARRADRVAPEATTLPGLGDWAVTTATLLTMLDELYSRSGPVSILECGSGSSTLFFALALAERGQGGQVVALESDAAFAEETREHLRRNGVDSFATVVDAPLVDREDPDGPVRPWFDLSGLPEIGGVDILFVDGPVGGSTYQARYPAYPVFGPSLSPGALVVLDDTDRPHETAIVERWLAGPVAGRRVTRERTNIRSTFLRVSADA